jgi:hypothetical protein
MLDKIPARWRHVAFALLGSVLAAVLPWLTAHAPQLVGEGVAHLPAPWAGLAAPFVGAIAAAIVAQVTALTRQYGVGQDNPAAAEPPIVSEGDLGHVLDIDPTGPVL